MHGRKPGQNTMTTKDKILRDTTNLRQSIRLDAVECANRAWSEDERTEVLEFAVQCALDLKEVIERLAVAA